MVVGEDEITKPMSTADHGMMLCAGLRMGRRREAAAPSNAIIVFIVHLAA